MKVYKLLIRDGGKLRSFTHYGKITPYYDNAVTLPLAQCGPLAAFKTLANVRKFIKMWWPSLCVGQTAELWVAEAILDETADFRLWFPYLSCNGSCEYSGTLPVGTVRCSAIQLRKQIKMPKQHQQ